MQEDFSYETGVLKGGGLWLCKNETAPLLKGSWGDLIGIGVNLRRERLEVAAIKTKSAAGALVRTD